MKKIKQKPIINHIETIAHSVLFNIESVDLTFSNGEQRVYERLIPNDRTAVMIVPILGDDLLLIREYAVAIEDYELGFPKGLVEKGETVLDAANRELMEEIGYGANRLTILAKLTTAPTYFANSITIVLAEELYPQQHVGDEPEPLIQVRWPIKTMLNLLNEEDFSEARNVSALFLTREHLAAKMT